VVVVVVVVVVVLVEVIGDGKGVLHPPGQIKVLFGFLEENFGIGGVCL